jgi:hypothetical protein
LWIALGVGSLLVAVFFYQVAILAAERLGDLVRSSFDLFRLSLIDALGRKRPRSLSEERGLWEELSQIVVYGVPDKLDTEYASPK